MLIYIRTYIYMGTKTSIFTHIYTYINTYPDGSSPIQVYIHTYTHLHTLTTHTHSYIHTPGMALMMVQHLVAIFHNYSAAEDDEEAAFNATQCLVRTNTHTYIHTYIHTFLCYDGFSQDTIAAIIEAVDEKEEVILQLEGPLVPLLHKLLKEGEYLYACMYVCMQCMYCIYVCIYVCMQCMYYLYVCMYVCMYVCYDVCLCKYGDKCMYSMYACKYLCASARMLV